MVTTAGYSIFVNSKDIIIDTRNNLIKLYDKSYYDATDELAERFEEITNELWRLRTEYN